MSGQLFPSLPPLDDLDACKTNLLQPVTAAFFIPKLENRPQNPIMDSLGLNASRNIHPGFSNDAMNGATKPTLANGNKFQPPNANLIVTVTEEDKTPDDIWMIAASGSDAQGNKLKTWDGLRSTYPQDVTEGDMISEQHPSVFVAAQEFVIPHVQAPKMVRFYLKPAELLEILMTNLIGHSSRLYEWDGVTEKFRQSTPHASQIIIAYGFTEELSKDIVRQHLGVGVCLRRLDGFILRMRTTKLHSTMHAFLHSLETIVASSRKQLQRHKPVSNTILSQLWLQYADVEETLSALAELCKVGASSLPPYESIPKEASAFLSYIYAFVDLHFQSASPRTLRSALAYLLTTASSPFFRKVEHSIGIGKSKLVDLMQPESNDDEFGSGAAQPLDIFGNPEKYPDFFSDEQKEQTSVATRSLKVLAAAAPTHPLLSEYAERRCEWVWHEDKVDRIYTGHHSRPFDELQPSSSFTQITTTVEKTSSSISYPPELASFKAFDMEPGSQWGTSRTPATSFPIDTTPYQTFLAIFPEELPQSTPTISHLAASVLYPLQVQSNRLTNALLSLFLSPPLSLPSHLSLLRSFALLGSQLFTYRLRGALFTESDGYQPVGRGTRARTRARLGIKDARDIAAEAEEIAGADGSASAAKWGIGLGLGLSERGVWPPGGAELGFALRRVIVDTLDEMRVADDDSDALPLLGSGSQGMPFQIIVKEAEWRLGFAIRDLPVSEGREEWLNPSSIAALDFLYLDYKPPLPVGALLTPEILSKYQRIFNFLLRLLRVETVSRGLFNSILKGSSLFTDDPKALGVLHRFRFHAHAFVSTIITYVFDTAIGIHFDGFISRLDDIATQHRARIQVRLGKNTRAKSEEPISVYTDDDTIPIADLFEIMADHSLVLDKILGGCVLRTQQRAIADVMDDILAILLRLGSLVRDLRRGALTNKDAATQLGKLHYNFERKMITFTKVLRAMDDKSELRSLLSALATNDRDYEVLSRNAGGPKREIGLSDLLVRLDPGEWWKFEMEKRAKAKKEKQPQAAM